jgi:hypothetical protein
MPEKGQRPAQKLLRRTEAATLSRHTWPIVGFGLLTLLLFGAVLFRWDTRVLGNQTTDLYAQFIAWRDFGSRQLRAGNLALWNPHIYAGAPYFGGFQAALLYPLNVLFLVMPVAPAVNWTIALHVWLLGVLTYGWLIVRRLHPGACFVGGALAVLEMGVFAARALDTFDSTTVGAFGRPDRARESSRGVPHPQSPQYQQRHGRRRLGSLGRRSGSGPAVCRVHDMDAGR